MITMLFLVSMLQAQDRHTLLREGDRAYQEGDFSAAEEAYKKASGKEADIQSEYNLGNSLYQQQRFEEALEEYQDAVNRAASPEEKSQAYYNLGNTYFMNQDLEKSIENYKNALKINPKDIDAKKNLSMAKKVLQQMQQQQQQQQQEQDQQQEDQNQEDQDQEQQDQQSAPQDQENEGEEEQEQQQQQESEQQGEEENEPQPQPGEEDVSKEEAERLLQIMDQEDKRVQEKMRRTTGRKNKSNKKW
jgi:tetratricopeptide (TPR) repeat protein